MNELAPLLLWLVIELPIRDGNYPRLAEERIHRKVIELPIRDGNLKVGPQY